MAVNINLNILPQFATTNASLNLINCINSFDFGYDNIYIIDENDEYTGFAVSKKTFRRIWKNIDNSLISVPGIKEDADTQKIINDSIKIFNKNPDLKELPLIKNNRITSVMTRKVPKRAKGYIWSNITDINLSPDIREYKTIYLSSLENQDIFNFYNQWNTRLPLIPLGNDNIMSAINDKDSLLIYDEDLFPECNKMSIVELWNKLVTYALKQMLNFCYISPNFESIKQSESHNRALFVQKFDQGFHSVSITDDNGKFVELMILSTFREDFLKENIRRWNNVYIDHSDNENLIKWNIANWCFGTSRKEIPILRDGKVVAAGRLGKVSSLLQGKEDLFPPIYWDLIDDEIAEDFFGEQRKILISSDYGNLAGFRKRFDKILDITVYDDSVWEKYLSGDFDMLIYGADVWPETSTISYSAMDVFIYLINDKIRRYLTLNEVNYIIVVDDESPIMNMKQRIKYNSRKIKSQVIFGGIYNDYFVYSDMHDENNWNFNSGIRKTLNNPQTFDRSIHFFGPCIVSGYFVNDSQTIESYLQNILNQNGISCKVINYGQMGGGFIGMTINNLYLIMDTNFNKGDFVILFFTKRTKIELQGDSENKFYINEIYKRPDIKNTKIFVESQRLHINSEGNKVVAKFLWEKLHDKLSKQVEHPRKVVKSIFNSFVPPPLFAA